MKKITEEELKTILEQHKLWLDSDGGKGKCADLTRADLINTILDEKEQENTRNVSEEKLLRLGRENLAMEIMVLRDKQIAREITFKESLKQSVGLIEAYDKNKIENYGEKELYY